MDDGRIVGRCSTFCVVSCLAIPPQICYLAHILVFVGGFGRAVGV